MIVDTSSFSSVNIDLTNKDINNISTVILK